MSIRTRYGIVAACWLAAGLRFRSLFAAGFHADEALFASWARLIAVWRDPLLQTQAVDKPPLLFYLQAMAYPLLGPVEWAARLPNLIAALLLIPLVGQLARRLYDDQTAAVLAALLLALSPLAVRFSAVAFTDPLLTAWLVAALALTVRPSPGAPAGFVAGRPGIAGLCFGLAVASKHQAWLFLPLVIGLALLAGWRWADWRRWSAGLLSVLALFLLWQVARAGSLSLWTIQFRNAGGARLAWSWELLPRLSAWVELWRLSLGAPIAAIGLIALLLLLFRPFRRGALRPRPVTLLLIVFLTGYGLLHWLTAAPVWDRYLLPVLPLVVVLIARGLSLSADGAARIRPAWGRVLRPAVVVLLVLASVMAAPATRADGGAARVAALLADAPYGTVLYDHWYDWHWRYELFDRRVYVSWFPHPAALLEDLAVFAGDGGPRYIVLPEGPESLPVRRALAGAGYALSAVQDAAEPVGTGGMALFRIERAGEAP